MRSVLFPRLPVRVKTDLCPGDVCQRLAAFLNRPPNPLLGTHGSGELFGYVHEGEIFIGRLYPEGLWMENALPHGFKAFFYGRIHDNGDATSLIKGFFGLHHLIEYGVLTLLILWLLMVIFLAFAITLAENELRGIGLILPIFFSIPIILLCFLHVGWSVIETGTKQVIEDYLRQRLECEIVYD